MSTTSKPSVKNGKPLSASGDSSIDASAIEKIVEGIIHFDATAKRRKRLKDQASRGTSGDSSLQSSQTTETSAEVGTWWKRVMRDFDSAGSNNAATNNAATNNAVGNAVPQEQPAAPRPPEASKTTPSPIIRSAIVSETPQDSPTRAALSDSHNTAHSDESLRRFLINFVVEQTGYPEDIVEMDADLEADLGIDSIKKAQMFGEIGEYFGLEPDENLSLDDFTTLTSVLEYLVRTLGSSDQVVAAEPLSVVGVPNPVALPANVTPPPTTMPSDGAKSGSDDLMAFLINFVVEQTGYPEDIVEMDADLEADLGIDSIKKAQMFGEIGEYFGLEPDENLSLDDFATLTSVLSYLEQNVRR